MTYKAPVRDLTFALEETADFGRLAGAFPHADAETVKAVLEAAGQFAGDVLAPLNHPGDVEGARYENGAVRAPAGFGDAYKQFVAGGWNSLGADEVFGGPCPRRWRRRCSRSSSPPTSASRSARC